MESSSSQLGMIIQSAGVALVAVLSAFLTRSIRRDYLRYWSAGWGCLAAALAALFLSFQIAPLARVLEVLYYLGEYAFGYLLVAGGRNYTDGRRLGRRDLVALPVALAVAVALSLLSGDFSVRFLPQAAILAGMFAMAFRSLFPARRAPLAGLGLRLTLTALALLALDFAHYVPVLSYSIWKQVVLPFAYRAYTSIYDLILEVLLAFGIVTLVMEDAQREVEAVNRELTVARDRLETLARQDPLTDSLNRHAFYSLLAHDGRSADLTGAVAIVDIDDLKPINDSFGHSSGDVAIRTVARALRSVVRPDDLVFRWGGDEFLMLLFGLPEDEARRRLEPLNGVLTAVPLPGSEAPVDLSVSFGVAAVVAGQPLERAIEAADAAMYRHKQARKGAPLVS